jgi:hypothetical protein
MRHHALAISAMTCIATLAPAGIAAAAPHDRLAGTETIVMTSQTLNGIDLPSHVSATGPIRGAGTETQTYIDTADGETVQFTWHFPAGNVTGDAIEDYALSFDPTSCTAQATGTGTWTITGGTGAYAGATGSGSFADRGTLVGARDRNGACQGPDSGVEPKIAASILRGTGSASLPSD